MQWKVLQLTLKAPKIQDKLKLLLRQKLYLFSSTLNAVNNVFGLRKAYLPKLCMRLMHSSIMRSTLGRVRTGLVLCFVAVLIRVIPGPHRAAVVLQNICILVLGKDSGGKSEGTVLPSFLGLYPTASRVSPDQQGGGGICSQSKFLVHWLKRLFLTNTNFSP